MEEYGDICNGVNPLSLSPSPYIYIYTYMFIYLHTHTHTHTHIVKGWKKLCCAKFNQKKRGVLYLHQIKKRLQSRDNCQGKTGPLHNDKRVSPPKRQIAIVNVYEPNKRAAKIYATQTDRLKGEADKSPVITKDFYTLSQQLTEPLGRNHHLYKTLSGDSYTCLSCAHVTYSKTDPILHLNKT